MRRKLRPQPPAAEELPRSLIADLFVKIFFGVSAFVTLGGCLFTYFWAQVICFGEGYAPTNFVVQEVRLFNTSAKGRRILAEGLVGTRREILRSWREYAAGRSASEIPAGETWVIMFNDSKGEALFSGRSLRALSLQDYANKKKKLAGSILAAANFPLLLLVWWIRKRKRRASLLRVQG
jgi:hypothetical protein